MRHDISHYLNKILTTNYLTSNFKIIFQIKSKNKIIFRYLDLFILFSKITKRLKLIFYLCAVIYGVR